MQQIETEPTPAKEPWVSVTRDAGVARVVLNRPRVVNALNHHMMRDLAAIFDSLEVDPTVRVMVLSGAGSGFCSGWDRKKDDKDMDAREALAVDALGQQVMTALQEMSTTLTVAGLHGATVGGGALLAAQCDFRIAADNAFVWMPEISFGSPLLWTGLAPLVRELGFSHTRYLTMSNQRLDTTWALMSGLVHEVVPADKLDERIGSFGEELAKLPPRGVALLKADFARLAASLPNHHGHAALTVLELMTSDSFQNL